MMNHDPSDIYFSAEIEFHPDIERAAQSNTTSSTAQANSSEVFENASIPPIIETQNNTPVAPMLPNGFVLLSQLLQGIPTAERSKIIDDFDTGIETGIVIAVRRQGDRFPIEFIALTGRKRVRKIADWMIMDTPRLQDWVKKQRSESHYAAMLARGEISISEDEILEDLAHFQRLAKMHRELLKKNKGSKPKRLKTTAAKGQSTDQTEVKT